MLAPLFIELKNAENQLTFIGSMRHYLVRAVGEMIKFSGNGREDSKVQLSASKVSGIRGVVGVAAGLRHALCVTGEGDVYCWGAGSKGQLGLGKKVNKVWKPVKNDLLKSATGAICGQYFTIVKLANGENFGFGDNKHQQLCEDKTESMVMQPRKLENVSDRTTQ